MSILGTILLGIIRLIILILVIFYLNKKMFNSGTENTFLSFFVRMWFRYIGLLGILIFISIELGFYSLYNLLTILLVIIFLDKIGSYNVKHFETFFIRKIKIWIHFFLKNIELKTPIIFKFNFKNLLAKVNKEFDFFLLTILLAITIFSRFYFFRQDEYALSNLWTSDLIKVMNFDNQIWFDSEMNLSGELAFTNFFSKLVNINHEVSLQSMAVLENIVLVIILYWVIQSITFSKYQAPLFSIFSFAVLYGFIPINMDFLMQPKPTFLALTFALPSMVFIFKPQLLLLKNRNFFIAFLIIFLTIGLIDLFVLCILLPPFLLISFLFKQNIFNKKYWLTILAYLLALIIVFSVYYQISISMEKDFGNFLHSNFISVNSYTYLPQMILSVSQLMNIYLFGAVGGILVLLILIFYKRENWNAAMAFLIYLSCLILSLKVKNPWFDNDLLLLSLNIFIPILVGIDLAILIRILRPLFKPIQKYKTIGVLTSLIVFLFVAFNYQKSIYQIPAKSDSISFSILEVYDQLISDYFPYSYAVVNDYRVQVLSLNEHFFLNYKTFLEGYSARDSVYFRHYKNILYFKKHPEKVIPKSVFLFLYKKTNVPSTLSENSFYNPDLMKLLDLLQKRGRYIRIFKENEYVKVVEIVNEPGSSKVSDLIF